MCVRQITDLCSFFTLGRGTNALLGVNLVKFCFLTFHLESSYDLSNRPREESVCHCSAQHFLSDEVVLVALPTSLNSLKINILT